MAGAGSGQRLGAGGPKAFVEVNGRTLLEWSLLALDRATAISSIVVTAPPEAEEEARAAVDRACPGTPATVIAGGATRADSVALALEHVAEDLVAIHDAARPLVSAELIDRVVSRLYADPDADGVIAAAPLADTIKRVGAPRGSKPIRESRIVVETVDRELLWAAQTPQAFRVEALRRAQESASTAGELEQATDEAWLIERAGGTVLIEPAPSGNLKVTTPEDLVAAAAALLEGGPTIAGAAPTTSGPAREMPFTVAEEQ